MGCGFASSDDIALDPIAHTISHLDGKSLFLARIDGEPAGAAAANITDAIGLVNGASTRPDYRRRGIQQALLAARINHVAGRCEAMAVTSSPGSASERNIQRFGFSLLHTKAIMIRTASETP
ncbi:MAG: GNAT family N-acetyltransferase [Deltaproteobacteria bacterium]|nr:GNAT family N-acetyltransferase [Deltaproteobacteria bacterium]